MSTLIVTGGNVEDDALRRYLGTRVFSHAIAVDAGMLAAERLGFKADYLVGDFDTLGEEALSVREHTKGLTVRKYNPKKDDTDTEIAVCLALELEGKSGGKLEGKSRGEFEGKSGGEQAERTVRAGFFPEQVVLVGASGTRFDHTLANVFLLARFEQAGLSACIVDAHNRVSVHHAGFSFGKQEQYGKYISFLALTPKVEGLTLRGFAYPLKGHTLSQESSLCISNEAAAEELCVEFSRGRLLMVESLD